MSPLHKYTLVDREIRQLIKLCALYYVPMALYKKSRYASNGSLPQCTSMASPPTRTLQIKTLARNWRQCLQPNSTTRIHNMMGLLKPHYWATISNIWHSHLDISICILHLFTHYLNSCLLFGVELRTCAMDVVTLAVLEPSSKLHDCLQLVGILNLKNMECTSFPTLANLVPNYPSSLE